MWIHDPVHGPVSEPVPDAQVRGRAAVAEWYHAAFTGLLLAAVVHRGTPVAAELVYRVFCRQREARFLPGLRKLGLEGLPHAVACAAYHYLSNEWGGVSVQFVPESDRKAWVRYLPPRWVWAGTALCGIPDALTVAMLRGWHAQNGTMLGNPRLGFVCTKTTTAGDAALEGYYLEHDRDLAPQERLRFARDEDGPPFDPAAAPRLPSADWPAERLARARRNYAMEYVRTTLPVAIGLLGADDATALLRTAFRQVGLQHLHGALETLGLAPEGDPVRDGAAFIAAMARGQGDAVETGTDGAAAIVLQDGPRVFEGTGLPADAMLPAWAGLWEGAMAAIDGRLVLEGSVAPSGRGIVWRVGRR